LSGRYQTFVSLKIWIQPLPAGNLVSEKSYHISRYEEKKMFTHHYHFYRGIADWTGYLDLCQENRKYRKQNEKINWFQY
jgi:hypothetical protein